MQLCSSAPQIRPAALADVAAMFDIRACVGENTLTVQELAALGITPETIAEAIASAPCAWVATVDEAVQGFAMVDLDSGCLFALFVRPGYEGRGMGSALTRVCEQALAAGHARAWLETARDSRAARLYQWLGWGHAVDIGSGDIRLEKALL